MARSGSFRPGAETLSPLREGPDPNGPDSADPKSERWAHWLCRAPSVSAVGPGYSGSDLRLLLGVLGAPLGPVHVSNNEPLSHLCIKDTPIVSLSLSLSLYCSLFLATFSLYFGKFYFPIVMVLAIIISCVFGFSSYFLAPRVMIQLGIHFPENIHLLNVFTV